MDMPITGPNPADSAIRELRLRADSDRIDRARTAALGDGPVQKRLRDVCNQFSGQFLGLVYKTMGGGEHWSDLGHGGTVEDIFREMSYEEYARDAAETGAGGLGDLLYKSLVRKADMPPPRT